MSEKNSASSGQAPRRGLTRRAFNAGAAVSAALVSSGAAMRLARAQDAAPKVGVLLPRSGMQGAVGQACQRGVDLAPELLRQLGYSVKLDLVSVDFESNVDQARAQAEKLIAGGANLLIGAFDSGATSAIAQVAEQKGVPLVINIAAAPQITQQGYKYVFRNFPTAPTLVRDGLSLMKDFFVATGHTPKTAVYMHVNDTFGQAMNGAIGKMLPGLNMPFKVVENISYDPAARDLSVEVAKAKASGAELVMLTSRLNDAILLVREMVKQRYSPMGIISPGSPGMYEDQFYATLGKYSDYCTTNVPWYNPHEPMAAHVLSAFHKRWPKDRPAGYIFNIGFTFEAILIAADAYARAKSTNGKALADALRTTHIDKHMMVGGPIVFDAQGQNENVHSVVLENLQQQPRVVLPVAAAEAKPVFPMVPWNQRS